MRLLTREALLSFRRAPLLSTLSITTIGFSLFTVGLFGLGHPELVVTGLDHQVSHGLLNRVARMVVDGRDLVPGEVIQDDTGQDILTVEVLPNPAEVLFSANRFYERPDEFSVLAFQLTWADAAGRFPWDPLCAYDRERQPRPGTWRA